MAKRRSRRQRHKKVAHSRDKAELGKKQLPGLQPSTEIPEVRSDDDESNSFERLNRGGGRGGAIDDPAEETMEGDIPNIPTDAVSGPAEERLGEWPFRIVRTPEDLLALGEWLQVLGGEIEKTPVGIAVTSQELALATKAQGWLIPMSSWSASVKGVLEKTLLSERTAPALVTRSTSQLVNTLEDWFAYEFSALLPNIVHDMKVLEYTTGRAIAGNMPALKDALDCAVIGPGLALEAPRFYREVGLPLVRFNTRTFNSESLSTNPETSRWTLTYDWLLFKVLAHYTRDPTLTCWLQDGNNPLAMCSQVLELESKETVAFLLWMVCGEDEELLSRHYPDWAAAMPEAPQLIKASRVDKSLPNLRLGLIRLTDQYATARKGLTLYGRRSPWGLRPAELLHFALMGSVNDLLDVVMASIIRMGSEQHWLIPASESRYNNWLRAQVVGYNQEEPMEWQHNLEQLGQLNNPLGAVSLEPRVSVE